MTNFVIKLTLTNSNETNIRATLSNIEECRKMGKIDVSVNVFWVTVDGRFAFCQCQAPTNKALHQWITKWSIPCEVTVVVDDNDARRIVLKEEPEFVVEYDANTPLTGQNVYVVEYKMLDVERVDGYTPFAEMSLDENDFVIGNNTCLGKWHNLANASGFVILAAFSEIDIYTWTYHWLSACDFVVHPVTTVDNSTQVTETSNARRGYFW